MDGTNQTNTRQGVVSSDVQHLQTEKQASWDSLSILRATWPDKERLLIARLSDSFSRRSTRSRVTDGHLSTLAFDRQARVAAQLPTGNIYSLSSKDDSTAMLMEMAWDKYIVPNANSQFDFLTKWRMTGVYASVYGACPIFYDYRITDTYIGPDCWIIPVRNFYPQPGKNSIEDMDWCMVSTMVSVSYLQSILKRDKTSWKKGNIQKLISRMKDGSQSPSRDMNAMRKSAIENVRSINRPFQDKGPAARLELITKYEAGKNGRWQTFAADYPDIGMLRDIPNPHRSGKIPIVMRQCFPLLESIFGLGDFERGISLQKAKDSLINLYLDAVKQGIFPALKIIPSQVTMSTIRQQAGARWFVKNMEAVQAFDAGANSGVQTFQSTYQFLTSALLQQNGTTNTQINTRDSGNPAFGKTPEALKMQQEFESARDNWDRFMLEKAYEKVEQGMINLVGELQEKPINFHLFDDDVKKLTDQFKQKPQWFNKINSKVGKVTLNKREIGGQYRFIIDDSSSLANDQQAQKEAAQNLVEMYMQNPQLYDAQLAKENRTFSLAEAMETVTVNSGLNNWEKIIVDHTAEVEKARKEQAKQAQTPQSLPQFNDPDIASFAQQFLGGQQQQPMQSAQPQLTGAMPQGGANV